MNVQHKTSSKSVDIKPIAAIVEKQAWMVIFPAHLSLFPVFFAQFSRS
jgi:hypothetical protein